MSFFLLPFVIGLLGYPISMILESDRFDYSQLNFLGRVLNLFVFYFIILFINKCTKHGDVYLLFKWYQIGVFILLLTALWHALSLYTNFVDWPFETRSKLHSSYGAEYSFGNRVTGIAREPSFFVMYVVDFIALSLVFFRGSKRNIIILFAIILMLLSLSPSGYIVLFFSFVLSLFFCKLKNIKFKTVIQFLFIFLLLITVFMYINKSGNQFYEYFFNRIANLDPNESSRLFMLIGPFQWVQESNLMSLLLGHGMKSYSIIGTYYTLPSGEPIHITSNNLYIDVFWESGIVGLIMLAAYFSYIFKKIYFMKIKNKHKFVVLFVFFDLVLSAFFRADYSSLRFFIILYLLFILTNYDFYKKKL
tara:strand:+ start:1687 stop:2772 length:1086 start_codon:yes stop_codon:yes gene_type:complete